MITKQDPCPTCSTRRHDLITCDACGGVIKRDPITVTTTIEGEADESHYCSVGCLLRDPPDMDCAGSHWKSVGIEIRNDHMAKLLTMLGR